ncbi:putative zeta toxin domain, P-loop containing nucleoside triphosphate hydrolase, partial [Tanacetum coccineum]
MLTPVGLQILIIALSILPLREILKFETFVLLFLGGRMGAGKITVLKEVLKEGFWAEAAANAVVVEANAFKETHVIYRTLSSKGHHNDMLQAIELIHFGLTRLIVFYLHNCHLKNFMYLHTSRNLQLNNEKLDTTSTVAYRYANTSCGEVPLAVKYLTNTPSALAQLK